MASIYNRKGNRYFSYGKWHNIGNLKSRYEKTNFLGIEKIIIFWSIEQ